MIVLLLTAVTAAAAVAAGDAPARTADACTLLSAPEVSAVLGISVDEGRHVLPSAKSSCGWTGPGEPSLGSKRLLLTLMSAQSFEVGKTPVKTVTKTAVSGVGDDAYFISTPPFGTALSVKKGASYFQVRIGGYSAVQARTLEKALALQLINRV